jgi:uncharacterized protein
MSKVLRDSDDSEWHAGELAMQKHAGVADEMAGVAKLVIRKYMLDQHREFFGQLPFVLAASVSEDGDVWGTMIAGSRGFIQTPNALTMAIESALHPSDPTLAGIRAGQSIGLLGIDLMTRRRNRMNGVVQSKDAERLTVSVVQSFGNCPRYIQQRVVTSPQEHSGTGAAVIVSSERLDDAARNMIGNADTCFVASYADINEGRFVDISHRGGNQGFVRVDGDDQLTIPDFPGNSFFNTLGNILVTRKAGLLFVDFSNGDVLQLTGDAEVLLDAPPTNAFERVGLFWRLKIKRMVRREGAVPLRWIESEDGVLLRAILTGSWAMPVN